jgi:hypothetical protein
VRVSRATYKSAGSRARHIHKESGEDGEGKEEKGLTARHRCGMGMISHRSLRALCEYS